MEADQLAGLATGHTVISLALAKLLVHRGVLQQSDIETAVMSGLKGAEQSPAIDSAMTESVVRAFLGALRQS